jgi:TRAP-type uncharacterized transport system fused permease subunit
VYIVPFMFIYEPALLLIGDWSTIVVAVGTAIVGVIALAAGLFGYLFDRCAQWQRVLLVGAALLLIFPGWVTDLAGMSMLAVVLSAQLLARARAPASVRTD